MDAFDSPGSRALLASALDAIIALDASGRVVEWNPAAEHVFGYTRDQAIGALLTDLISPPETRPHHEAALQRVLEPSQSTILGRHVDLEAIRSDGVRICVEAAIIAVPIHGPPLFVGCLRDITERKRAEAQHRESAQRLHATYEHAFVGITEVDPNGRYRRVNGHFCALTGYSRDELLARSFSEITHPEDRAGDLDLFRRQMQGELGVYTHEKRFIRQDSTIVWVELEASTVKDETGTPLYGIRVVRDITERKHAAEHQRVMLYELDHRVRNTLAIVQSIASHTLRAAGVDSSIAAALTDRLIALAGAHAVLSSESWEGGDLDAVVAKAISAHERIRVQGPVVRLRPSLIVMLSLVLHELATNAAKYGALSNETGWVDLSWKLADDRLSLSWRENGGPPAEPPCRRGVGSQLIERLIRAEGGAVLSTRYEPTGAEVDIEVPVLFTLPTTAAA